MVTSTSNKSAALGIILNKRTFFCPEPENGKIARKPAPMLIPHLYFLFSSIEGVEPAPAAAAKAASRRKALTALHNPEKIAQIDDYASIRSPGTLSPSRAGKVP